MFLIIIITIIIIMIMQPFSFHFLFLEGLSVAVKKLYLILFNGCREFYQLDAS